MKEIKEFITRRQESVDIEMTEPPKGDFYSPCKCGNYEPATGYTATNHCDGYWRVAAKKRIRTSTDCKHCGRHKPSVF